MKPAIARLAILLSAPAFLACGKDPVERSGDPQLTISADSVTVDVGASASVTATVLNTSEPARFVSRDPGVATVDGGGAVRGVAIGSTYVVATLPNRADVRDSVRVRVQQAQAAGSCEVARPDFGGAAAEAERSLFAYNAGAPLNLQKTLESTNNGVEVSAISFDSPGGGSATGLLFDPVNRSGPRPGIVLMHGAPGNARQMAGQGLGLAAHGAVVIAIDAPFARRAGPFLRFTPEDRAEQIQLMKDLQRAVDVLRARANVDDERIAYLGISYGGAMAPIEPIRFIPLASPTPLLLQNGRSDTLVPPADAEALHAAAPEPKTIRWYNAGHSLGAQALADRHVWLNAQIGLDLLK
jgi:dienelactone hydrolase